MSASGKIFDKTLVSRLFGYTQPYRKWFVLGVVLTITIAIVSIIRPLLYQYILDKKVAYLDAQGLRFWIMVVFLVLCLESLFSYTNTLLTNWLGQSVIRDIRNEVFQHILHLRLSYYDKTPIGTLQTRTISDVETLNDIFRSGLVKIMGDLLQLVSILFIMLYKKWDLALVVLAPMPLMIIATRIFQKKVKNSFQGVRKAVSDMNAFLQEHITGMNIVQVFNRENIEANKFDTINQELRTENIKSVLYYSLFFPVIEIITAISLSLLVWYGVRQIIADTDMTVGLLVAFISYVNMFFRPLRMLADEFNTLQMGMVSAERIFKVLDTTEFIADSKDEKLTIATENLTIEFKNVWFSYQVEKQLNELTDEDWVLRDISLTINAGEKVAFVGATGSGKTTIINLLGRFYEIQKGEILINGQNIKTFPLKSLRALMGVVLQDVFLFSGSIYDNITLNNHEISLDTVKLATQKVGAADFIENLPQKYEYEVRERGATLSLGQRQLIAFARVWVYNPQILILDEATANIDTESEEMIQRAVDSVMVGRTSIIIAHRLSTIQKADKIVVLEKGKLLEVGNHQSLLEKKGKYFELYQLQFA